MKEVEILVQLTDDFAKAKDKLSQFNFQGIKKTRDVYFFDPKRNNLQPDKKGALNQCFRLRSKGDEYYMTYKIDHFDNHGVWTYSDEHEVKISNFDSALKIINHLGLKQLIEIDFVKHIYKTDTYEIVLEDVKGLGLFLEVERLSVEDNEDIATVKNKIREFIKSLNVRFEELNIGKPELMLRKKNLS